MLVFVTYYQLQTRLPLGELAIKVNRAVQAHSNQPYPELFDETKTDCYLPWDI